MDTQTSDLPSPLELSFPHTLSARGRWVGFRPLRRDDASTLFKWHSDLQHLHLWSADRRLFAYENFNAGYRNFVTGAIAVLICDTENTPIGFCRAHELNFADGWLRLTLYVEESADKRLQMLEAGALFSDYLFKSFPTRKIYSEAPEYDADTVSALLRMGFVVEGRDSEHVWYGDQYWDVLRLSLFRDARTSSREELLRLADLQENLNAALGETASYEAKIVV